jgi:hypothetical protein
MSKIKWLLYKINLLFFFIKIYLSIIYIIYNIYFFLSIHWFLAVKLITTILQSTKKKKKKIFSHLLTFYIYFY